MDFSRRRSRVAGRLASCCQWWQRACRAVHVWHGHVARRPASVAGAALRWRESLWWQRLQCIAEAVRRAVDWRHLMQI